jgi:hypothetical protein
MRMSACPSDLAIDHAELHGGDSAVDEHLRDCAACQVRHRERTAAVALFEEAIAKPTWSRIAATRAASRSRERWPIGWALGGAGGCAVAIMLVVIVARPNWGPALGLTPTAVSPSSAPHEASADGYVGAKGWAATDVICRRGDRVFVLGSHDIVAPGDELRFRPRAQGPEARFIQIGAVDGTGTYTPFYPGNTGASSVGLPPVGEALAGSIRLDDAPGPERVLVVVSATSLAVSDVGRIAEARASDAKAIDTIGGVPVRSGWIVLAKRAGGPAALPRAP